MALPRYTPEQRRAARLASWQKYNEAHKADRAEHNKQYVKQPHIRERRLAMARARYALRRSSSRTPAFSPTTE